MGRSDMRLWRGVAKLLMLTTRLIVASAAFVKSIGADVVVRGALLSVVAISADIADGVAIINADINAIAEFTLLNLPIMISVKYSRY